MNMSFISYRTKKLPEQRIMVNSTEKSDSPAPRSFSKLYCTACALLVGCCVPQSIFKLNVIQKFLTFYGCGF